MAITHTIKSFGDFGDALYAHRQRLNALYAAIYGFGEHKNHTDDPMHSGIVRLCQDVADEAELLLDECDRLWRNEKDDEVEMAAHEQRVKSAKEKLRERILAVDEEEAASHASV